MELVATLGLDIDSSGTNKATKDIEQMGATGDKVAAKMRSDFQAAQAAAGGLGNAAAQSASQVTAAFAPVGPLMARLTEETSRWAIGMNRLTVAQKEQAAAADYAASANTRLLAGMSAAGQSAFAASAGARAWEAGLQRLAAQQEATTLSARAGVQSLEAYTATTATAGAHVTDLATVVGRLQTVFAALAVVGGIRVIGREFLGNITEAQAATAQLAAAVKSTGGAAGFTVPQLQSMASSLQAVTTASDEAVQGAQSILLTFRSVRGDQFREATAAVLDLAARMGGDLQGAALQVGKALQDPTQGLTALRRSGVSFSDAQQEVIKNLQATGQLATAQGLILKELQVEFGGSAAAARDTLGGALRGLVNDFGDAFEATAQETSGLVALINAAGSAARALTEHRATLVAFAEAIAISTVALGGLYAALAIPALAAWIAAVSAATLAAGTFGAAVLGGTSAVVAAAAPLAVLAAGFGLLVAAIQNAREETRLYDEEILGAARDARVLQALTFRRDNGQEKAQQFYPDVFPARSPSLTQDAVETEIARAKAAQETITALRAEADTYGRTAEQVRLYKIATSDLTDAEKALAVTQANRITVAERAAALRQLEIKAIEDKTARVLEEAEALEVARKATVALSLSIRDALAARKLEAEFAFQQTLADIKKGDPKGSGAAKDVVAETHALGDEWERNARTITAAGQAMGGFSDSTAAALQNVISVAQQIEKVASAAGKAGEKAATGDWLALAASAAGLLSSVFGGGPSPEERERIRVQRENTEAVRLNTAAKEFGTALTGNQLGSARGATDALLGLIPGGVGGLPGSGTINNRFDQFLTGGGLGTFKDLVDLAKQLGIQLDTSSWQAAVDSLQALDAQLKQNELVQFTETFTGKMKALNAEFVAFGIADPVTKLIAQLKVAGDLGSITHDKNGNLIRLPGTGSAAINAASAGLDLTTQAGLDQLTQNLQALFRQLQAGTLSASQLGGLTAQEFLDQLTGLIDLVKQAEDAARARERNLQDLEVRRLRATGQGTAADDLAFQLSQQREYQDAVLAGADAVTLSTLAEVQRAEALFRSTEAMQGAIDTLKQFSDSLKLDQALSTLSPVQQLEEARRQYQSVLAAAQGGDATAAGQLPEAARAFLEASRAVNASGPAYAADFARVMSETDALRQMFQDQKDIQQLIYDTGASTLTATVTGNEIALDQKTILSEGFQASIAEFKAFREESDANFAKLKLAIEALTV